MAALLKSFASMFLLIGVLSILTVSAWGQGDEVLFRVHQPLEEGSVLRIAGNSSEFRDGTMIRDGDDVWTLKMTLTGGKSYQVWLEVNDCTCNADKPYAFALPNPAFNVTKDLTGYFHCNDCLLPTPSPPPPPSPSPPPPSPSPPPPFPPPPSPPPPSPSTPPPSPPPPSPSPPPPSPPPPSPSPPPPFPPPPSPPPPPPSPPPPSPSPPPPSPSESPVLFVVNNELEDGVYRVVGNAPVLGDGDPVKAPNMTYDSTHLWSLEVDLTQGQTYAVNLSVNQCLCTGGPTVFTVPLSEPTPLEVKLNNYVCYPCPASV
ncbi:hypothetical protein SUGI_0704770 [Cryptomeria japonica]|uniref:uncharacterized protein LOC131028327 n=1 Tax=Cryptomeria japonica TaxID=3369 RepID=UPI0024148B28|nr:uncharacterized protein LOC131028327 [Cryptomeria japonica]GLJ35019.1 hypothetical protein SUGI_0704770 [Cryptomeria japonica]